MKKLVILAAALLVGIQANAQLLLNGNFNLALETSKYGELGSHNGNLFGLAVGATYYYSLDNVTDGLAILPGANLSSLIGNHTLVDNAKLTEVSLNVPIHLGYTYEISDYVKLFGQTGPVFQLGLTSKVKTTGATYSLYNKKNDLGEVRNRFNMYWGIAVGAELNDLLRVHVGVDLGLLNRASSDNLALTKLSRNTFVFGVAYLFGR